VRCVYCSIALPASPIANATFTGIGRMVVTSAAEGVDEPQAVALAGIDPEYTGRATQRRAGRE